MCVDGNVMGRAEKLQDRRKMWGGVGAAAKERSMVRGTPP